jgi:hypothetical protein
MTPLLVPVPRRRAASLAAVLLIVASLAHGVPEVAGWLAELPVLSWIGLGVAALLVLGRGR